MALFELNQHYENQSPEWKPPTFKDCAAADIDLAFFNESEFAEEHTVDGKKALAILEETTLKQHSAHWEAGAKQNFDTGLYTSFTLLYIRVKDYGPKPKVGKQLIMDMGTDHQRTYTIINCETEDGIYCIKMERTRQ